MVVFVVYGCLLTIWFLVLQTSIALWTELDPILWPVC